MRYDVIVSGAGPAGSTTARECADRGLSVLLLDKAEFPRDKPCGGGITMRAAALLPFDIAQVVERTVSSVSLTEHQRRPFISPYPKKVTYLTQRSRLDDFLAERAVQSGAVFRQREAVRNVERRKTHVVVRTNESVFEGRTLVAADGANGQTAKLAGIDVRRDHGIALEGNITPPDGVPNEWQNAIGLDFGGIPGGYGWLFPKGDHLNIGLGGWQYVGPTLRDRLDKLIRFYGFRPDDMSGLRGHHLPLRQAGSPLVDGNVLLVGDSAGLVDPLTGEGIYAALWSGIAAARQLVAYLGAEAPDLDGYRRDMARGLLAELRVSRRMHDVFHLWPGMVLRIGRRTPVLWRVMARLMRGEETYLTVMRKLGPTWPVLEFISDLVRVAPPLRRLAGLRNPAPPERFFRRRAQHASPKIWPAP